MTSLEIEASKLGIEANKLQLEVNKLNETIRNNNLNHKINLEKNDITRLYNDQLNERELKKLADEMLLAYDKLNEEAYYHDLQPYLQEEKAKLEEAIQNARNTTDLRTANISSLSGILGSLFSAIGRAGGSIGSAIIGKGNKKKASFNLTPEQAYNILLSNNPDITLLDLWPEQSGGIYGDGSTWKDPSEREAYIQGVIGDQYDKRLHKASDPEAPKVSRTQGNIPSRKTYYEYDERNRRRKERNEIPIDISSSRGPGYVEDHTINNPSAPYSDYAASIPSNSGSTRSLTSNYHDNTSGGTDYHVSGGHHSTGVIIAP